MMIDDYDEPLLRVLRTLTVVALARHGIDI